MGRKRKSQVKVKLNLKVDPELLEQLNADGVNKSRLFSIIAKLYLRKKNKK